MFRLEDLDPEKAMAQVVGEDGEALPPEALDSLTPEEGAAVVLRSFLAEE